MMSTNIFRICRFLVAPTLAMMLLPESASGIAQVFKNKKFDKCIEWAAGYTHYDDDFVARSSRYVQPALKFVPCDSNAQQLWNLDTSWPYALHELVNEDICLKAAGSALNSAIKIVACNTGDILQRFKWTTTGNLKLTQYSNRCIGAFPALKINLCVNTQEHIWTDSNDAIPTAPTNSPVQAALPTAPPTVNLVLGKETACAEETNTILQAIASKYDDDNVRIARSSVGGDDLEFVDFSTPSN
jgi:hypothetical protein